MNKIFKDYVDKNVEVYVDDMVAKTKVGGDVVEDLN
jgi:hypothetical protein